MACNGSDDLSHARTRCPAFSRFHWQHYADQAVLFVQSGVYFPINELASPCVAPDQDDCARTSGNMLVRQAPAYVVNIVNALQRCEAIAQRPLSPCTRRGAIFKNIQRRRPRPLSLRQLTRRTAPWVSEIAPMVRIMPDQTTRGAAPRARAIGS